jgi:hypothetical protein
MRTVALALSAVLISVFAVACQADPDAGEAAGEESNIEEAKTDKLVGIWSRNDQSQLEGITFSANGEFVRDRRASLNTSGPFLRDTGTYTVAKAGDKEVVTLKTTTSGKLKPRAKGAADDAMPAATEVKDAVFSFRAMDRQSLGNEPASKSLVLQADGESPRIFEQKVSWCAVPSDCTRELDAKLYAPSLSAACATEPASCFTCNTIMHTCVAKGP